MPGAEEPFVALEDRADLGEEERVGRRVVVAAHITAGERIAEETGEADRPEQHVAARVVGGHGLVDRFDHDRRVAGEAQSGKGARRPHAEPLVRRREVAADQRHVGGVVDSVEVGDEIAGSGAARAAHLRRALSVGLRNAAVKRRVRKRLVAVRKTRRIVVVAGVATSRRIRQVGHVQANEVVEVQQHALRQRLAAADASHRATTGGESRSRLRLRTAGKKSQERHDGDRSDRYAAQPHHAPVSSRKVLRPSSSPFSRLTRAASSLLRSLIPGSPTRIPRPRGPDPIAS